MRFEWFIDGAKKIRQEYVCAITQQIFIEKERIKANVMKYGPNYLYL